MVRPKQQHDESRVALLDAARRLLATDGAGALTVRRLAAEAGLSTMAIYSRYGGKDGIVDALFVEGFDQLAAALNEVATTEDSRIDLQRCGDAYRRFALANPTSYAVMFQNVIPDFEPADESLEVAAGTLDLLAQRVQRALDDGSLHAGNTQQIAALLWAAVHGVVSLELGGHAPPWIDFDDLHRQANQTLMRGLSPS